MWIKLSSRGAGCLLLTIIGLLGSGVPASADEPMYAIQASSDSTEVTIMTYDVGTDAESALVQALVQSGPYNRSEPSFTNETISQEISGSTDSTGFFSVATFQSAAAADKMANLRRSAVQSLAAREPIRAKVVEHLLADWGWERGREVTFTRLVPGEPTRVFDDYTTTLAFFKSGYTGQMSMLEFFQPGVQLEEVRAALTARRGMSGATIYRDHATGNYVVFSEYFDTASARAAQATALVVERRVGQVTQNYAAR